MALMTGTEGACFEPQLGPVASNYVLFLTRVKRKKNTTVKLVVGFVLQASEEPSAVSPLPNTHKSPFFHHLSCIAYPSRILQGARQVVIYLVCQEKREHRSPSEPKRSWRDYRFDEARSK